MKPVVEARVRRNPMGGLAAEVTTTALLIIGVSQLFGVSPSGAITERTETLGIAWGVSFVVAGVLIFGARFWKDLVMQREFEIGSAACAIVGVVVYILAVFKEADGGFPTSAMMPVLLSAAACVNLSGRSVLLFREMNDALIIESPDAIYVRVVRAWRRHHSMKEILRSVVRRFKR